MSHIKRLIQTSAVSSVGLVFALTGSAFAISTPGGTKVHGDFQTAVNPACTIPAEDCITDQLTGSIIGYNELTTLDYTQTATQISYHDHTVITVTDGAFAGKHFVGNEHGKINKKTGMFHSCAEFTATDGSDDHLLMHYDGHINLDNNHDTGKYHGTINGSDHC